MTENNSNERTNNKFGDTLEKKASRRLKARRTRDRSVWFGLGMFGLVGWTVAIHTILGILLGMWIDNRWPGGYSWTLTLLIFGMATGLFNAWHWVQKESKSLDEEDLDEERD